MASIFANIAFQIGLATGHFKSYENLMYPLFGLAAILGVWWIVLWIRNPKETTPPAAPSVHVENEPTTHIENKPIFENRPVFENKPTIIVSTGAAPAPASDHAYSEVLAFLERTSQPGRAVPYFVEDIAAATGLSEQQVADALKRLCDEEHVFRRGIEGRGRDRRYTKWGYVYWYAHLFCLSIQQLSSKIELAGA